MKKRMFLIAALAISVMTYAQRPNVSASERAAHKTEKMKANLGLTDAQYASVKKINEQYAEKYSAIRSTEELEKADRRSTMFELRRQHQTEINGVLTPEQQQKWKALKDEHKDTRKEHRHDRHGKKRHDIKAELSLNDSQQKQMESERESMKTKMKSLRDDTTLNEDQKKEKALSLKKEHENAVKAILTPEQFTKWQEMKDHRGRPERSHHKK